MSAHATAHDAREPQYHLTSKRSFHIHEDDLGAHYSPEEHDQADTARSPSRSRSRSRSQTESQSQTQRADDDYDEHERADDAEGMDRAGDDDDDDASESSDEDEPIDVTVQQDMEKLQQTFPHFRDDYRLIKRIGEGTSIARRLHRTVA